MIEFQTIEELVEENHLSAYTLDCYGIKFQECSDKSLDQVCRDYGINTKNVVSNILKSNEKVVINPEVLRGQSVDLIIAYLKHAHHIFVRISLPYMSKLIHHLRPKDYSRPQLIKDFKIMFPLFAEDFIQHIHEEEDQFFHYVNQLSRVSSGSLHINKILNLMDTVSLAKMAANHENADDEMSGIRAITNNYTAGSGSDLLLRTLYRELKQFETELVVHAKIENEILFPKAIAIESQVKSNILQLRRLN